jgi:hypothetical protein
LCHVVLERSDYRSKHSFGRVRKPEIHSICEEFGEYMHLNIGETTRQLALNNSSLM